MSNMYNVSGFLLSLIFIASSVAAAVLLSGVRGRLRGILYIFMASTAAYILGMVLILTRLIFFVVIGMIFHICALTAVLLALCFFIADHFGLIGGMEDAKGVSDMISRASDRASRAYDSVREKAAGFTGKREDVENAGKEDVRPNAAANEEPLKEADTAARHAAKAETSEDEAAANEDVLKADTPEEKAPEDTASKEEDGSGTGMPERGSVNEPASMEEAYINDDVQSASPEAVNNEETKDAVRSSGILMGIRVLAAVKDEEIKKDIERIFKDRFADITITDSGREAIEICRGIPFELLIIDQRLSDLDGVSTFNAIHNDEQGLNGFTGAIALTSENISNKQKYFDIGFEEVVHKPATETDIKDAICSLLVKECMEVNKDSTVDEKLHYLEQCGLRVKMGITNAGGDKDLYMMLLKSFRDNREMRQTKISMLLENIADGDDMWEFLASQISDVRIEANELGNNELADLLTQIEVYIRAEDLDSINSRMTLVNNLWDGLASVLQVL